MSKNKGQFKKGHVPWSKGTKGALKPNKTSFRKGNLPHTTLPPGTVVVYERYRYGRKEVEHTINIDWRGHRKSHNSYKWYLWEVENQQDRPKGMVLALKNGDPYDIRVENLELISRGENMNRNRSRT